MPSFLCSNVTEGKIFSAYPITLSYPSWAHSWMSAYWKTNTHPLLQSAFYSSPFKINIKIIFEICDPSCLNADMGNMKQIKQSTCHPSLNVPTSQGGKESDSAATAFLVLAERTIPISRTEFIWIYLVNAMIMNVFLKTEYKSNQYESDKRVINITNSSQRHLWYGFC